MADIETLSKALKNADAAAQKGVPRAAEDARKLAQAYKRMKSDQGGTGFMAQVNQGIAETAGGLVDWVNPFDEPHALNPFPEGTGSAQTGLEATMEATGIDRARGDPDGFWQGLGRGTGNAAGAMVPAGKAAQALKSTGGMVGNIADDAYQALSSWLGVTSEISAGALARAASEKAEQDGAPQWVQDAIGMVAGVGGASVPFMATRTPSAIGAKQAYKAGKRALAPYTNTGAREVARSRVQGLAGGEDRARELAGRIDPNEPFGLTPAQQTGDPNMIALEQAGARTDPNLGARLRDRSVDANANLQNAVTDLGGNVEDAQGFLGQLRKDVAKRMDSYVAWTRADAQSRRPKVRATESENSAIVADRIRDAEQSALTEEAVLWAAVPKTVTIDAAESQAVAKQFVEGVPWAQANDIPGVVRQYLETPGQQSVEELHGLYSELRRVARSAMAGNDQNKNKARIANAVADAVLKDLGASDATSDVGRAINRALEFSAQLHETFDRGTVGRLLKRTLDGDEQINPQETLARSVGQRGIKAKVADEEIAQATKGSKDVRAATADYLTERFNRTAFSAEGAFNPGRASEFMRDNKALLARYPKLRNTLRDAIDTQQTARRIEARIAERKARLEAPNASTGGAFVNATPGKAVDAILKAKTPAREARNIVRQARKDKTGAALDGVKAAFADRLIADSLRQIGSARQVVGQTLADRMDSPEMAVALRQVFSSGEMARLRRIRDAALKLDAARKQAPDIGSVSQAQPNRLIEFAVRIAAANHGAQLGKGAAGLQTAQMASGSARKMLNRLMNDKAEQLLLDAIEDPKLFRALLMEPKTIELRKPIRNRIAPYLVGAGAGVGSD